MTSLCVAGVTLKNGASPLSYFASLRSQKLCLTINFSTNSFKGMPRDVVSTNTWGRGFLEGAWDCQLPWGALLVDYACIHETQCVS